MERNNDLIVAGQLAAILAATIIGVGILSLPRAVVEKAGPDGWMLVIAGGVVSLVVGLMMFYIIKKFPKQNFLEYTTQLLGKPIATLITLGFSGYFIVFVALEARIFATVTKQYLLFNTPTEVLVITVLILAVYLTRSGIESIGRMCEILFPIATIAFFIILLPITPELDLSNFLPVMRTPVLQLAKGVPSVFFSFIGIELVLLLSGFVKDTSKIKMGIVVAITLTTGFYLAAIFFTVARFGLVETTHILYPLLEVFKTVDLPGAFIENIEAFMMALWIISVFLTIAVLYFGASLTLSQVTGSREQNYLVLPLLPIMYYLALVPENIAQLDELMSVISNFMGTFYMLVLPVLLLVMSIIRKKKGGKQGA